VPFDFLRKKGKDEPKAGKGGPKQPERTPTGTPVPFDGLTEEWRLVGRMYLETRLSDALNKRESLAISDVQWAPIDGSSPFSPVPGLKSVDPYDLIVVIAGEPAKSSMSATDKAAALGQKTPYDVTLEAPPLRIEGRVYLSPGMAPERLMERSAEMFVPVVGGVAYQGGRAVTDEGVDAILVNRFYLRGVTVTTSGRSGDDEPLSQPGRTAPPPPAASLQPTPPPFPKSPAPAAPKAPAPLTPAPKAAPPWASRTRPDAGPAPAAPAPPRQAPAPESKPRVVPDWPAADRKPEPQPKKAADVEWPAADRKPEGRSAPPSPRAPSSGAGSDDPPVAKADPLSRPEPAPSAPEPPPSRPQSAADTAADFAREPAADPAADFAREPVDRPEAEAPPPEPTEHRTEGIAEAQPRAEAAVPPPAPIATSRQPSTSRRDAGSKGWPAPETGCRPKRGGLGPRN
jgi:hypothetical protein